MSDDKRYKFHFKSDVTAYDLALILEACQLMIDQETLDKLSEEAQKHFIEVTSTQ